MFGTGFFALGCSLWMGVRDNIRRMIIAEGPMQGCNASFQIENGGISDFLRSYSNFRNHPFWK
ncbi:hypothetical protein IMSAGC013_00723 [Lachnospiraceae bacterium]|nr:hypothetical protein IMSAGC013_00723 [Lachnospiraceae bacterium]